MINDIILEILNALLIAGIILYQLANNRYRGLSRKPGARLILVGFCLMLFGACLDITDEFPRLNQFVVIGDTPAEAFIEKFFGYMLGSLLLLIGFSKILPVFAELDEKRQLIETIVETIPAPTFCKDASGRYLACNQAFEAFTGLVRERIVGHTVFDVAPEELARTYQQADQALLDKGGRQTYEAQVKHADGSYKDVLFHKAVYPREDGSAGGIVGVMLDISAQKEVEEGLRRLDRMKSEFISIAAHELRTPLTSVQGYTELLLARHEGKREFSAAQQENFLHEIYDAGEALSALVDELLDVGRIESGNGLALNIRRDNPAPLLERVVEAFRLRHPQQPIRFDYTPSEDFQLNYDAQRFRQVVENLLSNAVKYSPGFDQIEVHAGLQDGFFRLQVRDRGVGMTAEECARIYDKFYRADSAKHLVGGLGLGMSIARNIVEEHGGRIRVESAPDLGTLVEVEFPLNP